MLTHKSIEHPDLLVVTGLSLGAEQLGAEAAVEAGLPYIAVLPHEGRIDLSATLESLGIDDNEPSLTAIEKKATLRDLIEARSGVYHSALYETPGMKAARPQRGSHAPVHSKHGIERGFGVKSSHSR